MAQSFGSKRTVVGAHYGLRDWLSQRVTAALMALFTLAVIVQVLLPGEMGYDKWAGIFSRQWMKALTFVVIVSLLIHAWVGMRDIWMDYVKPMCCAWPCRCSPSSGWWAVPGGRFRFCGDFDASWIVGEIFSRGVCHPAPL